MAAAARQLYHHQPLPDAGTYIRLLELEDRGTLDRNGKCCKLTLLPMDEAPVHWAISHTCGDPELVVPVEVNGQDLWIPQNTADVLCLLTFHQKSRFYWIDAICIEQDNIPEKNSQVALMGEIFPTRGGCARLF